MCYNICTQLLIFHHVEKVRDAPSLLLAVCCRGFKLVLMLYLKMILIDDDDEAGAAIFRYYMLTEH